MKLDSERKEIMESLERATTEAAVRCSDNERMLNTTNRILDQLRRGEWPDLRFPYFRSLKLLKLVFLAVGVVVATVTTSLCSHVSDMA